MTYLNYIEEIDEILTEFEDSFKGIEGDNCTKARKYLDIIKKYVITLENRAKNTHSPNNTIPETNNKPSIK